MPSNSITLAYLFAAALLLCSGTHHVLSQSSDVRDCQDYTDANTTHATCNDEPGVICTGGCTGYVTAHNCTRSQQINVQEPPLTTEKCTLGFGKSSATMYICINEQFSFTCYGASTGKAQCKGCSKSNSTSQPDMPSKNNNGGSGMMPDATTMPGSNNSSMGKTGSSDSNGMPMNTPATSGNTSSVGTPETPTTNSNSTGSATMTGANVVALLAASFFPSALLL